jgi:hypothetical protein
MHGLKAIPLDLQARQTRYLRVRSDNPLPSRINIWLSRADGRVRVLANKHAISPRVATGTGKTARAVLRNWVFDERNQGLYERGGATLTASLSVNPGLLLACPATAFKLVAICKFSINTCGPLLLQKIHFYYKRSWPVVAKRQLRGRIRGSFATVVLQIFPQPENQLQLELSVDILLAINLEGWR